MIPGSPTTLRRGSPYNSGALFSRESTTAGSAGSSVSRVLTNSAGSLTAYPVFSARDRKEQYFSQARPPADVRGESAIVHRICGGKWIQQVVDTRKLASFNESMNDKNYNYGNYPLHFNANGPAPIPLFNTMVAEMHNVQPNAFYATPQPFFVAPLPLEQLQQLNEAHCIPVKQSPKERQFSVRPLQEAGSAKWINSKTLTSMRGSTSQRVQRRVQNEKPSSSKNGQRTSRNLLENMDKLLAGLIATHPDLFVIAPDSSVFAKWDTISSLGSGTYASVYEIRNKKTGEIYAAKLLEPQKFRSSTQKRVMEMFANEIQYSVSCRCPGVVDVKQVVRGVEGWLIVQELIDGGTLWDDFGGNSEAETFSIFLQLFQTILWMQERHVVHRDLKPTNILRSADGLRVWVTDFGWSEKFADLNRHTHELPGTIEINPPEVLNHQKTQSEKIDNYALAMNMLLVIGRQFVCRDKGLETTEAANKIVTNVEKLRRGRPLKGFSTEAWNVFLSLSELDPTKRFSLAQVMECPWFLSQLANLIAKLPLYGRCNKGEEINKRKCRKSYFDSPIIWHASVCSLVCRIHHSMQPRKSLNSDDNQSIDNKETPDPQGLTLDKSSTHLRRAIRKSKEQLPTPALQRNIDLGSFDHETPGTDPSLVSHYLKGSNFDQLLARGTPRQNLVIPLFANLPTLSSLTAYSAGLGSERTPSPSNNQNMQTPDKRLSHRVYNSPHSLVFNRFEDRQKEYRQNSPSFKHREWQRMGTLDSGRVELEKLGSRNSFQENRIDNKSINNKSINNNLLAPRPIQKIDHDCVNVLVIQSDSPLNLLAPAMSDSPPPQEAKKPDPIAIVFSPREKQPCSPHRTGLRKNPLFLRTQAPDPPNNNEAFHRLGKQGTCHKPVLGYDSEAVRRIQRTAKN